MLTEYRPRIADRLLKRQLDAIGAVLIEGPKQCGKTTTSRQVAKSVLFMDDPNSVQRNLSLAKVQPSVLLEGDTPRLIDEWQLAPNLWDAIRFEVDNRGRPGQFILTGSAIPADRSQIFHTGTGRFAWLRMRPMSLFESGESNGAVSLQNLFSGKHDIGAVSKLNFEEVAFLCCRGGWPNSLNLSREGSLLLVRNYFDAVVREDVSRADGIKRNPERIEQLLRSYARNQGSQVSVSVLCQDMSLDPNETANRKTVDSDLKVLREIFVIEDLVAWNPNLRSKTVVRSAPTRYFVDPSLCAVALGIGPKDLVNNPETFGFVFETLCVRDLRVYADVLDGTLYHYRDRNGLECDAVLHLRSGVYGLIEIKLGGDDAIEHGAETLKKLASKIDSDRMGTPAFLMVLTAVGEFAYRREDGVFVVPIGCLKD